LISKAVRVKSLKLVELLLKNIDDSKSLLEMAVVLGNFHVVKYLTRPSRSPKGSKRTHMNYNYANGDFLTALDCSISQKHRRIEKYLRKMKILFDIL